MCRSRSGTCPFSIGIVGRDELGDVNLMVVNSESALELVFGVGGICEAVSGCACKSNAMHQRY
jgi:hypothetical protein